jgi:ubiquinone/menaquinone biosynthesis C-methylase UbiE
MSQERNEQQPQVHVWNSPEVVKTWEQEAGQRQHVMEEATEEMLLAAGLKSGDHVLDLAAGTGDQSILAARKVGPECRHSSLHLRIPMAEVVSCD